MRNKERKKWNHHAIVITVGTNKFQSLTGSWIFSLSRYFTDSPKKWKKIVLMRLPFITSYLPNGLNVPWNFIVKFAMFLARQSSLGFQVSLVWCASFTNAHAQGNWQHSTQHNLDFTFFELYPNSEERKRRQKVKKRIHHRHIYTHTSIIDTHAYSTRCFNRRNACACCSCCSCCPVKVRAAGSAVTDGTETLWLVRYDG